MKLIITDLDGTLFDTKDVNYYAYKEACEAFGYQMDYKYYCEYCNGRHYMEFLPQITTDDVSVLRQMHDIKKAAYGKYLDKAVLNIGLVDIITALREKGYKTAVVTTASKQNCYDILGAFDITGLFDLVLTHDDIVKNKPDPEGFLKAMKHFNAEPDETIIFEDSEVGLAAAKSSGARYYRTYGFN